MPERIAEIGAGDDPAEEMVRRERDRMRSVLEGMGEAFVLLGHDYTVLDINAEGLRLETRGRDAIVGHSHWDVWPNTKDSAVGRLYQHAMASREPVSLEHCYQWPDGREHWIDMRAYPVPDGLAVFYRDITQRKHAERELVELHRKVASHAAEQEAILGQLTEGVIVTDTAGRITFVNEAAERLHGMKLLGVGPNDYTEAYRLLTEGGEPYPAHELPLARAVLNGETVLEARWRIARADGQEVIAIGSAKPFSDSKGRPLGAVLTVRDDTERHRAERALTATSTRLDAILNNTRMAVFLMDDRQHCVFMNKAAEELTGYRFEETTGRPLHDVIHHTRPDGPHFPLSECAIDRAFPERTGVQGEETFVHKSGAFYPVAFTASPMLGEQAEVVGTVIEVRDITAEKQAEETRNLLMHEVDHRSRNVLAIVQSLAQLTTAPDLQTYKQILSGRIGALARAQTSLASRQWQGGQLEEVIRTELFALCRPEFVTMEGPPVALDAEQIQPLSMLVHELATNASKYGACSVEEGRLSVTWSVVGGEVRLIWVESGGPAVTTPSRQGFGAKLKASVTQQLGATFERKWEPSGLVVELRFPLGNAVLRRSDR